MINQFYNPILTIGTPGINGGVITPSGTTPGGAFNHIPIVTPTATTPKNTAGSTAPGSSLWDTILSGIKAGISGALPTAISGAGNGLTSDIAGGLEHYILSILGVVIVLIGVAGLVLPTQSKQVITDAIKGAVVA